MTVESIARFSNEHRTTHLNISETLYNMAVWSASDGRGWGNPDHSMLWTRWVTICTGVCYVVVCAMQWCVLCRGVRYVAVCAMWWFVLCGCVCYAVVCAM